MTYDICWRRLVVEPLGLDLAAFDTPVGRVLHIRTVSCRCTMSARTDSPGTEHLYGGRQPRFCARPYNAQCLPSADPE